MSRTEQAAWNIAFALCGAGIALCTVAVWHIDPSVFLTSLASTVHAFVHMVMTNYLAGWLAASAFVAVLMFGPCLLCVLFAPQGEGTGEQDAYLSSLARTTDYFNNY